MDRKETLRRAYGLRERMVAMSPPRVLLAEDDVEVRRVVAAALRLDGYSVIEAEDGADLLEQIGSALLFGNVTGNLEPVALLISDIRMPGHSGLDVIAGLRSADVAVATIIMSAQSDLETREHARQLGVDAFVPKPFELDALRAVVHLLAPIAAEPEAPPSWQAR